MRVVDRDSYPFGNPGPQAVRNAAKVNPPNLNKLRRLGRSNFPRTPLPGSLSLPLLAHVDCVRVLTADDPPGAAKAYGVTDSRNAARSRCPESKSLDLSQDENRVHRLHKGLGSLLRSSSPRSDDWAHNAAPSNRTGENSLNHASIRVDSVAKGRCSAHRGSRMRWSSLSKRASEFRTSMRGSVFR